MDSLITYYLEMQAPQAFSEQTLFDLKEIETPQFQFNRFLYQLVGSAWQWTDKLSWNSEQWQALVNNPYHRTWVAYQQGAIVGYYELQRVHDDVELLYFGLSPQFIGNRLGKVLLEAAIRSAWQWQGAKRVWVHTCNLDHPAALANYQARGFTLYDQTEERLPEPL